MDMTLLCPECGMEIKMKKKVWFFNGKSYHPECVQDNPELYREWIKYTMKGR